MSIYRKLKDYIHHEEGNEKRCPSTTVIFGDLLSSDCEFHYPDKNDEWKVFHGGRTFGNEQNFLYEYYVRGVQPSYKIIDNKIIPYLVITLGKDDKLL